MNTELLEALEQIEKEKDISKETLLEAIENSLLTACKNHFGKADNVKVNIDPVTCQFSVYAEKTVVEKVVAEQPDMVMPVHCTGIEAICMLKSQLGDKCIVATAGNSYEY